MNSRDFRLLFLYEWKSQHNAAEAARNINAAFGDNSVNERTIRRWYEKFENGDESLSNEDRGRPETVLNDDTLRALVEANPANTVRDYAQELNVTPITVSRHLKIIGKVKKLDKWIPHELNENQKIRRFEISSSLLQRNKNDPFLNRIVTCDEKWILYDNRRRSAQWLDADEAAKHFAKPQLHQKKIMVTVWWSAAGLIHYSFLNTAETITADRKSVV